MPRLKNDYSKAPPLLPEAALLAATRPPWGTTFVFNTVCFYAGGAPPCVPAYVYYAPVQPKIQAYASISPKNVIK